MSWVEKTVSQVDFLWDVLQLNGTERILDLACGLGRHSIELAKRGCSVVGIDLTADYINEAKKNSKLENVCIDFQCKDIRDVRFQDEFDVVLNMADGAIGYLEDEIENEKIFKVVSDALKSGGKHVMDHSVCPSNRGNFTVPI
ncbi:MAG: class I SAM-dependent methyltransferase [Clostridiaceae bacterium]|nr:class I SAM-dependent methyltransferase [Clostridiaceae bacterium]